MIKGSCCCGAIQFELSEKPGLMGMCHCSRCRKMGAGALIFVNSDTFSITAGHNNITTFKAQPPYKYHRCFCSICGTALGEVLSGLDTFPINANCIDSEIEIENKFHEFVADKPSWLKIGDNAQQFDEHPN
ncbi:aldehyde-activating protein [Lacimicrobium alkaliphilum]|uniref:Aldehyde-activating protein n=2 Tax=Lacimicrobium alkaliphilum TaxID=1526571 RepID=A0A0U2ZQQ8_9ALTE|nr:aldehyde-activating protein [Lacimicrobium alkaliphilum]